MKYDAMVASHHPFFADNKRFGCSKSMSNHRHKIDTTFFRKFTKHIFNYQNRVGLYGF